MSCSSNARVLVLVCLGILLPSVTVHAQQNVTIKNAEKVIGTRLDGNKVRKLIGNVHLISGNVDMFSDSTHHYLQQGILESFGNIQINTPNEHIWADSLHYNMESEISRFRRRVVVKTNQTLLFSHKINYNFLTRTAFFLSPVRLEDPQGILTAGQGYYLENRDSAVFRRQVQMSDSLQYVEGDSLHMNRARENYQIFGRVFADDDENDLNLTGNYMEADSVRRMVEGDAYLQRYYKNEEQVDTTHIWAKKIIYTQTDSTDLVDAYGNVHIWSRQFSATADSARYRKKPEIFELWSNPRAWHKSIQLTGPNIIIYLTDQQVERLVSYPSPFAVKHDTTLDRFHQIKGDTLTGYFTGGNLKQIHVRPNSELLYFTSKNDKPDGAIRTTARSTRILFEGDSLKEVKSEESIDGTYLPESQKPSGKKLEGFVWEPKLRPRRPDTTLKRKWGPVPDEPPFPLPPRYLEFKQENPSEFRN